MVVIESMLIYVQNVKCLDNIKNNIRKLEYNLIL